MKKLLLVVLLVLGYAMVQGQQSLNVLYIGNSYTDVNNLPGLIDSVARSAGMSIAYNSNTPGGCTFAQHCQNQSMDLIRQGGWDYVVLQEQSQLPSFPQSQVEQECLPYAAQLAAAVESVRGRAMFYMTWGRKNGDRQNAQYFPVLGTYEGMDSMLYERYMYMATQSGQSVCPVGRVWRYLRSNNPEIELYQTDESHPSMAGSYAAACAFFTMMFHADPMLIAYTAGLDAQTALTIRNAVRTVVYADYDFWYDPANYEAEAPINVLFVGNSYTSVNNLPALVDSVARSAGQKITHSVNAPGGCTFAQHCQNQSMTMIRQGGWDYVVLQEQSQLPSFPQGQVEQECLPYGAQLAQAVADAGGRAMFYMTWGRKNGDQQNAQYFPVLGTYEGMDSMLYMRYMYMVRESGQSVCPVGRVWRYLRTHNPEIELYQADESHPSMAGSYAAACAFFTMLFDQDPLLITYTAGLGAEESLAIREAVRAVVYEQYDYWYNPANYPDAPHEGIDEVPVDGYKVYPNPATSKVTISGDFELLDMMGRVVLKGRDTADISHLSNGIYVVRRQGAANEKLLKR